MKKMAKKPEFLSVWVLLCLFCMLAAGVLGLSVLSRFSLPDTVGRVLTDGERAEVIARNSPLTEYVFLTPNADFPREGQVQKITIHHMAGDLALEALGDSFARRDRKASANYAIDSQGRVALYVEEGNRAWTSSSPENDGQAVTIEVANDEIGGDWHVSERAFEALIDLCVDVCRRNGIEELRYTGDEGGTLTLHSMFSDETECPGPYLTGRMEEVAQAVNSRLKEG